MAGNNSEIPINSITKNRFLVLVALVALTARAAPPAEFVPVFQQYGAQYEVDWMLLAAVAKVESNYNPTARNRLKTKPCIGIMQILCKGYPKRCTNRLPSIAEWPPANPRDLNDPETNIRLGAQILAWNIAKYGRMRGIAVYNAWASRRGEIKNADYVVEVMRAYENIRGVELELAAK